MDTAEIKVLKKIEETLAPFDNYVAKMEIEEPFSLASNRTYLMEKLEKVLDFASKWKIIPITSNTGQGKTFLYWKLQENLSIQANLLFMDVPPNPKLFFYDLYTNVVEKLGPDNLREITNILIDHWGANELKYGIFRSNNPLEILSHAQDTMRYKWSHHKSQLLDCMKIIIIHALDPEKMDLAERWMFGEVMDPDELYFLGVQQNLSAPYMAEEMLKLIVDYVEEGIILFYDDIDINWSKFSGSDNWEADWADSHINHGQTSNSNSAETNFFEMLIILMKYTRKIKIIMTMDNKNINLVLDHFPESMKFITHSPFPLLNFSSRDAQNFYLEVMNAYYDKYKLTIPQNNYFPLTKNLVMKMFLKTNGNPRKLIREIQRVFDLIIFDELNAHEIESIYK